MELPNLMVHASCSSPSDISLLVLRGFPCEAESPTAFCSVLAMFQTSQMLFLCGRSALLPKQCQALLPEACQARMCRAHVHMLITI